MLVEVLVDVLVVVGRVPAVLCAWLVLSRAVLLPGTDVELDEVLDSEVLDLSVFVVLDISVLVVIFDVVEVGAGWLPKICELFTPKMTPIFLGINCINTA